MYEQIAMVGLESTTKVKKSGSFAVRVNERIAKYGVETITEAEIISILTGIPVEKLNELIAEHGVIHLARIIDSLDITDIQKKKLSMVFEISRKVGTSNVSYKESMDSSSKSGEYFVRLLSTKSIEEFVVTYLDSQNKIIKTVTAFKGTINETAIYPREIVKMALMNNAAAVILAHNHPASGMKASLADIDATKKIKEALGTMNIKVIDHVIVCGDSFISFAEQGLL